MIVGDIEGHQEVRYERVRERNDRVKKIFGKISNENSSWVGQVKEVRRLGRCKKEHLQDPKGEIQLQKKWQRKFWQHVGD